MDPLLPPTSSPDIEPKHSPNAISDELFDRYLAGEASAEERAVIQSVIDWTPEVVPTIKNLLGLHLDRSGASFNEQTSWDTLHTRIAGDVGTSVRTQAVRPPRNELPAISRAWALAAAVVFIVVVGSLGRLLSTPSTPENVTVRYTTRVEEQATLTLSDGTRVTLAPQTTLEVDRGFDATSRTVKLTGIGYFDVTAATSHPFVVQTGPVTTRVLGTTFTVRRYANETTTQVAVVSGRVAVGVNRFITLQRGDVARVTDSTSTVIYGATLSDYTAWTTGKISFTRTRVTEVLSTIGQWYGVTFDLADSAIGNRHLTVSFTNSTRAQVLATLQELLDVRMTVQGSVITVTPRSVTQVPLRPPALARHQHLDTMFSPQREIGR